MLALAGEQNAVADQEATISTSIGTGELLCATCGAPLGPDLKCSNGHELFSPANAAAELARQLKERQILSDTPIELHQVNESTIEEDYRGIEYNRTQTQYETAETRTRINHARRSFLGKFLAWTAAGATAIGTSSAAGTLVQEYRLKRDTEITSDSLDLLKKFEHGRNNLIALSNSVPDHHPFKTLLHLQIGILDGSDLRNAEAAAEYLVNSQTGPARTRAIIQLAKVLLLTGRPTDAISVLRKEFHRALSRYELQDLSWQLLAGSVAALDENDVNRAPQVLSGTVKAFKDTVDAVYGSLFRQSKRRDYSEDVAGTLELVKALDDRRDQELGIAAVQSSVYLNIMRNQGHRRRNGEEVNEAVTVAHSYAELLPRHGWNVLSVVAALYWHFGRLTDALVASDAAEAFLTNGNIGTQLYAQDQRAQKGTEFVIFATTRARLLYERGIIETNKGKRANWHSMCTKWGREILDVTPNVIGLGRIERARQYVLADIDAIEKRRGQAIARIALAECKSAKPASHSLYGAMPSRSLVTERVRQLTCE